VKAIRFFLLPAAGTLLVLPMLGAPASGSAPCIRPTRAGTQVQGEVQICPGRYRVPDPRGEGVIVAASSGTRIDLTGVTLTSGDTLPERFTGHGVRVTNLDNVTIIGGTIRGYQYGIRIEGGRGHRVNGTDVSGSRAQRLLSTPERFDERDWLDIFRPDTFERYGSGVYLRGTDGAVVTNVTSRGAQNGIGLFAARNSYIADNDVSGNSGWGIHLWQSSQNAILRNRAHHNVRCESERYRRGCDSAGILLREQSDSNTIADNDLSRSGDGFFLSGHRPLVKPSVGNLVIRNDATGAWHNAFESTFSWGNTFIENRADSSDYGFWLGYSSGNLVRGNSIVGSRTAGIAIEHGGENTLAANVIISAPVGIRLFTRTAGAEPSRGYTVDDNVLARVDSAIVLRNTTRVRMRGNLFDGVGDGLVADSAGRDAAVMGNVFLRAERRFIVAPALEAGGNYWGMAESAAREKVAAGVTIEPWRPARAAGY
jgi:parallel beta-helix repeat protein